MKPISYSTSLSFSLRAYFTQSSCVLSNLFSRVWRHLSCNNPLHDDLPRTVTNAHTVFSTSQNRRNVGKNLTWNSDPQERDLFRAHCSHLRFPRNEPVCRRLLPALRFLASWGNTAIRLHILRSLCLIMAIRSLSETIGACTVSFGWLKLVVTSSMAPKRPPRLTGEGEGECKQLHFQF